MIVLKLEKVKQTISSFNPRPSLSSITTEDRKQFQRLNIVSKNRTVSFFLEFNWYEKRVGFLKRCKLRDNDQS